MSARELGARMEVTPQAVSALEHAERSGGIRLSSLRRAASAMDCDVVYALVPRRSLDHTVRLAAENAARRRLGRVAGTMALEDQTVGDVDDDQLRLEADLLIEAGQVWAPVP
jgi:predicted DNA-binding mobile mystery protein A